MVRLAIRDPWGEFETIQDRVSKMFNHALKTYYPETGEEFQKNVWTPAVDIHETENNFVVKADVPGINKDDIQIDLKDNTLTIKGEKKFENKSSKDNYIRVERSYGSFVRSFVLPQNVDGGKITATYKEGVLEVTLPKKEESKPKQIKVEVN